MCQTSWFIHFLYKALEVSLVQSEMAFFPIAILGKHHEMSDGCLPKYKESLCLSVAPLNS